MIRQLLFSLLLFLFALHLVAAQDPPQEGKSNRPGDGVTAPILIRKTEPVYPEGGSGDRTVRLYAQINPQGQPVNMKVLDSVGEAFDKNAPEAVAKWVFKPGTKDGRPVTVESYILVNFKKQ
jgi:protein TonB